VPKIRQNSNKNLLKSNKNLFIKICRFFTKAAWEKTCWKPDFNEANQMLTETGDDG